MIESIFIYIDGVLTQSWYLALSGAFLWGILSVMLSPCHLGSIPLVVAWVNGQGKMSFAKAFQISLTFSIGLLSAIIAIGAITGVTGRILGDIGFAGYIAVSAVFILIGLHFLGLLPLPDFIRFTQPSLTRRGLFSGFLLGFISGLALGPCTFAFMAPVLAVVFNSSSVNFAYSLLLIIMYALGHCLVFVIFGTFSEFVQRFLNWNDKSHGTVIVRKIIGVILILSGLYVLINNRIF